jgi:branched-chain amino acid transport system substrate-binding protein
MTELKKTKINDMFAKGAYIRPDGLMIHDMYVMQVKSPQESKYPWDLSARAEVIGRLFDGRPGSSANSIKASL